MSLDAMAATYRRKTDAQAHEDARNVRCPKEERITVWKPAWIPVVALASATPPLRSLNGTVTSSG